MSLPNATWSMPTRSRCAGDGAGTARPSAGAPGPVRVHEAVEGGADQPARRGHGAQTSSDLLRTCPWSPWRWRASGGRLARGGGGVEAGALPVWDRSMAMRSRFSSATTSCPKLDRPALRGSRQPSPAAQLHVGECTIRRPGAGTLGRSASSPSILVSCQRMMRPTLPSARARSMSSPRSTSSQPAFGRKAAVEGSPPEGLVHLR